VPAVRARVRYRRRTRFFAAAPRYTPYVAVEVEGVLFTVSTADQAVGGRLFVSARRTEFDVLAQLMRLLDDEGVGERCRAGIFVDVGANIGTSSLTAVSTHGFRAAIAVEPDHDNTRLLKSNIALNGLYDRITTYRSAVSDRAGTGWLIRNPRNSGGHRLGPPGEGEGAEVEVTTLDGLLEELGVAPSEVGVLWIDVQGHERQVLEGARRVLEAAPPIVVELSKRTGPIGATIAPHFTRLVDLRSGRMVPAAAVDDLVAGERQSGRRTTDALLLPEPSRYPRGA
jgi:FkbM family methyltransferase